MDHNAAEPAMMQPNVDIKEEPNEFGMDPSCFGTDCETSRTNSLPCTADMAMSGNSHGHSVAEEMTNKVNSAAGSSASIDTMRALASELGGKMGANASEASTGTEESHGAIPGGAPAVSTPDFDTSGLDLSWLSSGEKPLNIADLSFEQFQLLYYQHLFKNMKDVAPTKTKSKPEKRNGGEVASKIPSKAASSPGVKRDASGGTASENNTSSTDKDGGSSDGGTQASKELNLSDIVVGPLMDASASPKPPGYGFTHKCSHCDEMFRSRLELTAHDKRAHPTEWDSDLQCEKCSKKFSSKYYLNQHELTHKGELPFSCDLCDKRFLCKGTLETHVILLHTDERPHKCDICGAAFKLKKILMRHISTHTKEAPYKCPNCDKCFSRRGSLNRHELIHTGEKPFKCELCDKCFTQKSTLTLHMMGHNNERPYQCSKCDKSFRKKSHLTRHDSVHTGKKRYYECKVCKKCFAEKYCLVEHEKTHQGEANIASFYLAQHKKGNRDTLDYFKGDVEESKSNDSEPGKSVAEGDEEKDKDKSVSDSVGNADERTDHEEKPENKDCTTEQEGESDKPLEAQNDEKLQD
ncbi:uncharacterized protein [Amphiura filiformis]|uniref:uncharacterized protein n=1 Tax=Amphiura filiformis TaxID=82378 RepID=UPI003B222583